MKTWFVFKKMKCPEEKKENQKQKHGMNVNYGSLSVAFYVMRISPQPGAMAGDIHDNKYCRGSI